MSFMGGKIPGILQSPDVAHISHSSCREFPTVEECEPLLEPYLQAAMVVLLTLQGKKCSLFQGVYQFHLTRVLLSLRECDNVKLRA